MAFGYVGMPFPLGNFSIPNPIATISKLLKGGGDILGRPYFLPIRIDGQWLPNAPTMSIQCQKRIISTLVAGKAGTVKELISTDDYKLQIRGFAINFESNDYPYDDVEKIKDLWLQDKALEIYSDLTTMFEINNVVIESLSFPELVGMQNVQPFELSLISDDDFDVIVK